MTWLTEHWGDVAQIVAYVIAAAHIVTELTPTPRDDNALAKLYSLLEVIGFKLVKSKKSNRIDK